MFDFLFKNKGSTVNIMDLISIDVTRLYLSKMAIDKAVGMIAGAIAKSEFIVLRKSGREKDDIYWELNVRPNPNETATDFWIAAIRKLLTETECVICMMNKNLYLADSFTVNNSVLIPQVYRDVTITANDETFRINRTFTADEVMHLRTRNKKIKTYLENVLELYDKTLSAITGAMGMASTPKFSMEMDQAQPVLRSKNPDGTIKELTIDQYKNNVKKMLESDNIEIITNVSGAEIKQLEIKTDNKSEDIVKMAKEIFVECALAFDIPKAVFLGEITEKADSTNEFITFAVGWIVEVLNDSLNAKMVGKNDYLEGESIWIDMSKYKHVDIIESAANLDKLRSIGFSFDEILELIGREPLNTEFSQERVVTKNYENDAGGGEE